jgi:hypothetical protein
VRDRKQSFNSRTDQDSLLPHFTAKTIVNYYLVVAAVFATAKDRTGKQMFRHSKFSGLRDDKDPRNIVKEQTD